LDYLEAKYSTNADNTARCVKRRQRREEKFVGENNSFIDYWEKSHENPSRQTNSQRYYTFDNPQ
jgi:hypothetical protein